MAKSKELTALFCRILSLRSISSDNEYFELLDAVKLLHRQHRHVFSCLLPDAHNVGFAEICELELCLAHGVRFYLYTICFVGLVNKLITLPHGYLIDELVEAGTSLSQL